MSDSSIITPRGHQEEALEGLRDVLGREDRAQVHMCCGSGKTFVQAFLGMELIEASEDPSRAIVVCFVPNRALVQQNARDFRDVFGDAAEMLGVCSEADLTGLVDMDEADILETTTDPERIRAFFARTNCPRVVVCTYPSAVTLREALRAARGDKEGVLLGLFDEAHRTAGDKSEDDLFAYAFAEANFPIGKRAFFTATPRSSGGRKAAPYSMSNTEVFGPVAYCYTFRRGISDGRVVDYDLWVPIITRAELAEFVKDQGLEGEDRAAVALIALEKVMKRPGQSRFLAYRQRVAASKLFAKELVKVFPHSFVGFTETVLVIEGTGRAWLGEREVTIAPGDALYIPAGVLHGFKADDDMKLFFTFPTPSFSDVGYEYAGEVA